MPDTTTPPSPTDSSTASTSSILGDGVDMPLWLKAGLFILGFFVPAPVIAGIKIVWAAIQELLPHQKAAALADLHAAVNTATALKVEGKSAQEVAAPLTEVIAKHCSGVACEPNLK